MDPVLFFIFSPIIMVGLTFGIGNAFGEKNRDIAGGIVGIIVSVTASWLIISLIFENNEIYKKSDSIYPYLRGVVVDLSSAENPTAESYYMSYDVTLRGEDNREEFFSVFCHRDYSLEKYKEVSIGDTVILYKTKNGEEFTSETGKAEKYMASKELNEEQKLSILGVSNKVVLYYMCFLWVFLLFIGSISALASEYKKSKI